MNKQKGPRPGNAQPDPRAQTVLDRMAAILLTPEAERLCLRLWQRTLNLVPHARYPGASRTRSYFDLAYWSRAVRIPRSSLRRIILRLEERHILSYTPDLEEPGRGWLEWNMNLDEWLPYDLRRVPGGWEYKEPACESG